MDRGAGAGEAGPTGPVVLVLRALGLGDGLTGVPALRGVRRLAGPDARLVLAAPAGIGGWLVEHGLADELLVTPDLDDVADRWRAEHRSRRPDLAVDLHGSGPRSHRLLQSLRPHQLVAWRCSAAGHLEGPRHDDDEHEVLRWCRLVRWAGGVCGPEDLRLSPGPSGPSPQSAFVSAGPPAALGADTGYVVVHPGAASGSRCWPADRFARVVASLVARGERVLVTGSAAERRLTAAVAGAVGTRARGTAADARSSAARAAVPAGRAGGSVEDLGGRLDLAALARVVAGARLVVCGDTGVAHLATAFGVRSVLLFGPTPPAWWGPAIDIDRHRVLWHGGELAPRGRRYVGDPHGEAVDPALARIGVDEVLAAVAGALPPGPAATGPTRRGHADLRDADLRDADLVDAVL